MFSFPPSTHESSPFSAFVTSLVLFCSFDSGCPREQLHFHVGKTPGCMHTRSAGTALVCCEERRPLASSEVGMVGAGLSGLSVLGEPLRDPSLLSVLSKKP